MQIPNGMTENEVVEIINKIARRLSTIFRFGYYSADDIFQEAWIIAIEGLNRYSVQKGPLENFLWIHVRNRLCNFKRNKYERLEKPCKRCIYDCEESPLCEIYNKWLKRRDSKKNLVDMIDLNCVDDKYEKNMKIVNEYGDIDHLSEIIDKFLPPQYRRDYLQMIGGIYVPKKRRIEIQNIIREILEEHGYDIDF